LGLVGRLVEVVGETAADVLGDPVGVLVAAALPIVEFDRRPGRVLA
jgi:hypothetical protein